ncbi:cytochrome P450 [Minwuia sp.]|uniref:cytochrome P450 n=1 Tax=Minwuia sp. TaxID=2493630 RepID=UPI003A8DB780
MAVIDQELESNGGYPRAGSEDLAHLPGNPPKIPLLGTIRFIKDPLGTTMKAHADYGNVYKSKTFMQWSVSMLGPDALEMVLMDREKNFSSRAGWHHMLSRLFSDGLMLRDFDDHRAHRKVMQVAFKPGPMKDYLLRMNGGIEQRLDAWGKTPEFKFYPQIKQLTLDMGASVFLGIDAGPEAQKINQAFVDEVAASIAVIRKPVRGFAMHRGVEARKFLNGLFADLIVERRAAGEQGEDMFSQLCYAESDEGQMLTDQEIIDHMNFLLMAAHDTTTSSLTTMMWALAAHPEWQERLRKEITEIGGAHLSYEDIAKMENAERVFKEALRMIPPVPFIPRRVVRDFEFEGKVIPAGSNVSVSPGYVHMMPELWTDPAKFDPDRFSPNRAEDRNHKFAWAPFGGGAHKCLGIHFAYMQVKAFAFQFLQRFRISLEPGYEPQWARIPIPKPLDGLPVKIEKL